MSVTAAQRGRGARANARNAGARRAPGAPARRAAPREHADADAGGVNKLKSGVRQTKRLLARDALEPGKRIEAERRLLALERELETRLQTNKVRALASRYHKVKFFERQKLHRRIRQMRRASAAEDEAVPGKARRRQLKELRVFLNYVLHFPKNQRYFALLSGVSASDASAPLHGSGDSVQEQAADFLRHVRRAMKKGALPAEPDIALEAAAEDEQGGRAEGAGGTDRGPLGRVAMRGDRGAEDDREGDADVGDDDKGDDDSDDRASARPLPRKRKHSEGGTWSKRRSLAHKQSAPVAAALAEDDFFA
ncbi:18S rRNA maturation protein [Malassezia sp. CBS 17886]|nr:18S rRNA maturation protein [Malassezia sp. CBS 17886]